MERAIVTVELAAHLHAPQLHQEGDGKTDDEADDREDGENLVVVVRLRVARDGAVGVEHVNAGAKVRARDGAEHDQADLTSREAPRRE